MARERPTPLNKNIESQGTQIRFDVVKFDYEKALEVIKATEKLRIPSWTLENSEMGR